MWRVGKIGKGSLRLSGDGVWVVAFPPSTWPGLRREPGFLLAASFTCREGHGHAPGAPLRLLHHQNTNPASKIFYKKFTGAF